MSDQLNPEKDLQKIEEVTNLVKSLCDGDDLDSALKNADSYLKKTDSNAKIGINKSQINKYEDEKPHQNGNGTQEEMSEDAFKEMMERDAKERTERKARNKKLSEESKNRGNDYFKAFNYEKAIDCYSEAINIAKDFDVLYTNRANCYLKMKEYQKALKDCEAAMFLSNNKSVKAMNFQGKALLGLKRYADATDSFKLMEATDPKLAKMASECVAEVEAAQRSDEEELAALSAFGDGASNNGNGVVELMEKLHKKDQAPIYYSGGLRVLADALISEEACILFRSKGGFESLLAEHPIIKLCLTTQLIQLQKDKRDLLLAVIELLCKLDEDNEENQKRTLQIPGLAGRLTECLDLTCRSARNHLRQQALKLLFMLSRSETGRRSVMAAVDPVKVVPKLFTCIHQGAGTASQHAASLLNNLALSERFQAALRSSLDAHLLPSVEKLLSEGSANLAVLPSCINCVMNLCHDAVIRRRLACRSSFLAACAAALERNVAVHEDKIHHEILAAVLGVLTNVSLETSDALVAVSCRLTKVSLRVLKEYHSAALRERILALLGHVVPKSEDAVKLLLEGHDSIKNLLLKVLEDHSHPSLPCALKILTACVKFHDETRYCIGDDMRSLEVLMSLLHYSKEEQVVGNAALCIAECIQDTAAAELLTRTDVMQHLLVLVRELKVREAKVNCAILAGKLAQANPRHRQRLQELEGFQILDKVMGSTGLSSRSA